MPKAKVSDKEFIGYLDRLPPRERVFVNIKKEAVEIASFYGFEPIQPSMLEDPRVFQPLVRAGFCDERMPVVAKTSAGIDVMLRFSAVLGILRAYVSHKMNDLPHPLKFLFQGENYYQTSNRVSGVQVRAYPEWGVCMIGEEGPIAEAEIIQVIWKSLEKAGVPLDSAELRLNAISCSECRPSFRSAFVAHFRPRAHRLCKNCKRNLKKNPTKILLCKEESCRMLAQNAPQVLDHLCEACKKHLRGVLEFLDETKIPYGLDSKFFRDGSLYSTILFEFILHTTEAVPPPVPDLLPPVEQKEGEAGLSGRQVPQPSLPLEPVPELLPEILPEPKKITVTLAEGGRMSKVGELIVGRKIDVASGIILLSALEDFLTKKAGLEMRPQVFLAQLGDLAKRKSLNLIETLRAGNITLQESLGRDSVKSQLNVAERVGAEIALILGQKEALDNTIIVREISSGMQETVPQDKLIDFLRKKLKR